MQRTHVDREARALKAHRNEDAALHRVARLAAHPAGLHRSRGPDDKDGSGDLEFRGDLAVEFLTRRDLRVPPDRPALRLDRGHQWRNARLVAAGVGNENVGHAYRASTARPAGTLDPTNPAGPATPGPRRPWNAD